MRRAIPGILLFLMVPLTVHAVPLQIPYTGQLAESGQLVTGNRDLVVSLYADSLGGSSVYTESFPGTAVTSGVFRLRLNAPASVWSGSDRWLGVSVNGGTELAPRTKLGSVPYAVCVGATTHTHHLALHSSAFVPFSSSTATSYDDQSLRLQADDHILAPVQLPDSAVITGWKLCGYFPTLTGQVTGYLMRRDATLWTGALDLTNATVDGSQGTNVCLENAAYRNLASRTIDNTNYVYFVRLDVLNAGTPYNAGLLSVRVDYTLPDPNAAP